MNFLDFAHQKSQPHNYFTLSIQTVGQVRDVARPQNTPSSNYKNQFMTKKMNKFVRSSLRAILILRSQVFHNIKLSTLLLQFHVFQVRVPAKV